MRGKRGVGRGMRRVGRVRESHKQTRIIQPREDTVRESVRDVGEQMVGGEKIAHEGSKSFAASWVFREKEGAGCAGGGVRGLMEVPRGMVLFFVFAHVRAKSVRRSEGVV